MKLGVYGILIIFGLFILLLVFNPKLSCFGKRVRSPFYPLVRKRRQKGKPVPHDYGFRLSDAGTAERKEGLARPKKPDRKTEDYGFRLD